MREDDPSQYRDFVSKRSELLSKRKKLTKALADIDEDIRLFDLKKNGPLREMVETEYSYVSNKISALDIELKSMYLKIRETVFSRGRGK